MLIDHRIDDAEIRLVDAEYADCSGCAVHRGFKKCKDRTIDSVLTAVRDLRSQYPSFKIVVTGHSMGGAVSHLVAIDLLIGLLFILFNIILLLLFF